MSKIEYMIPGNSVIEKTCKEAYWDIIFEDIIEKNNYDLLLRNIEELKGMLISLIPNRGDIHNKEFNEFIDIPFLKQKFENGAFKHDDFVALFNYIIDWIRRLGCAADEQEVELFKKTVIEVASEKGYFHVLPYAFDAMHTQTKKIIGSVASYREKN